MKRFFTFQCLLMFYLATVFCQDSLIIKDIDGNEYKTVSIGNMIWMAENLKTTKYNEGTPIKHINDRFVWKEIKSGGYMWYEYKEKNYKDLYGALYNWYAVNTGKLCPEGWHVPSDDEWNSLEIILGMSRYEANNISYRSTSKGGQLKSAGTVQAQDGLWHTPNEGATNETGFSANPGGFTYYNDGFSYGMGSYGFWWSSTEYSETDAWYRLLYFYSAFMSRNSYNKGYGFSVRCIKDE